MARTELIQSAPENRGRIAVRQDLVQQYTIGRKFSVATAAAAGNAEIEACITRAKKWPRKRNQFAQNLVADCSRRRFTDSALYSKPVGRKKNPETGSFEDAFAVEFSVQFIEATFQHFKNVDSDASIEFETETQTKLVVAVFDLLNTLRYKSEALIDKLIERRELKGRPGPPALRESSFPYQVYPVAATVQETRNLAGAEKSKVFRDRVKKAPRREGEGAYKAQIISRSPPDLRADTRALPCQHNTKITSPNDHGDYSCCACAHDTISEQKPAVEKRRVNE